MSDTLDDVDDLEGDENSNDLDVEASEVEDSVSKKKRAAMALEARLRVELKLEEAYIRKQTETYYFD
tara:strand:+ start:9597 stop:9797 length:201 start_codon:yes stop_codon:yes gene_type:complete